MTSRNLALGFDLGGTKVMAAVVNHKGKVLQRLRQPTNIFGGPEGLVEQLADLGQKLIEEYPEVGEVGIASAGPLDPIKGLLLDPTNFLNKQGEGWGVVPLTQPLSEKLGRKVYLDNDAAATAVAEKWVGTAKNCDNFVVLTLGTGVGVGTFCNGRLMRSGHGLHPEASHISIDITDETAPCNCGKLGCVEAYLSGRNFAKRYGKMWGMPELRGERIKELGRQGDERALEAFSEYARFLAYAIDSYVVLYAPEKVILSGGFSDAADLFLPQVHPYLEKTLARRRAGVDLFPEVVLSELKDHIGLLGGASIVFHQMEQLSLDEPNE